MLYEEIRRDKTFVNYQSVHFITYSVQEQIHFNCNVFGNKCCRCNEGSLYILVSRNVYYCVDTLVEISERNGCNLHLKDFCHIL